MNLARASDIAEVVTRQKEIQYSSCTRANRFKYTQKLHGALACLLEELPKELRTSPTAAILEPTANRKV